MPNTTNTKDYYNIFIENSPVIENNTTYNLHPNGSCFTTPKEPVWNKNVDGLHDIGLSDIKNPINAIFVCNYKSNEQS